MSFAERDERTIMSCCAVGCTNRFNKFNKTRKFYRIPSTRTPLKANRRRLWLQAIRRSDWNEQMIKNATICSDHFISAAQVRVRGSLTLEDHLLAILMKLRLGLSNKDIAFRFNVTQCDISKILRSWLPVLSQTFETSNQVAKQACHIKEYAKLCQTCIIDCTEICINRPTNLTARAQTYSNYKSHNTVKYLVGMSPAGAITFMSSGWGGRVSDKQITAESGFYDLLEVNDEILADRGFTIRDELALCGATLRIPHFTRGKKQLSAQEVETSRRLSNVRIHIERIIGRWKTFRILTTVVPLSQVDLLDDIVIVCAALTNICKCIVPRK
ncbi:hypothetical protein N1851_028635 [Merluccius polli]|uniref:THAP-type domain-containing protein n=1 Tax=Merluccius polli TaxID=89951 RepID=A0AA47M8E0_MERPO|nr:hypothetical protein N1851_028635 [Merluccius polli]